MLDGMRKMSQSLLGRLIMGLVMGFISLSFAIWGVGNIFVGYGAGTVAKVGSADISVDAYRQTYQTLLQNTQRDERRQITNDEARARGLDRRALNQLIGDATLDLKSQSLGLALSNTEVATRVLADPSFQSAGKFDPNIFNEALRDAGLSEVGFRDAERKLYLRQQLVDSLIGGLNVPEAALEAIHRFRDETRSIDMFELPASAAGEIPAPDDATLQAWFEQRKDNFRAPAYRKLVTLAVTPSGLAKPDAVSDDDARALYDKVKGQRYGTSAKRHIEQIVFPDEATAKQASEQLKNGASFAEVAAQFKLSASDLDGVAREDIFDKAIADAVFALPEGGVSEPVKGQFGFTISRVVSATPESVKPFEEVSAGLKMEIALTRAKKTAGDIRDKIEDERTSGKPLTEAAAVVNLKPVVIDAITETGLDKSGAEVQGLVERDALLHAAFASDIGVDNDVLNTRDGGFEWFEVAAVEPARAQTLDEVKDKAIAAWRDDEIAKRLSAKAEDLVKQIAAGANIETLAKDLGLDAKTVADVRRIGQNSIPPGVVARVFSLPTGAAGSAEGTTQSRFIFKILDSVVPVLDKDSDIAKTIRTQLQQGYMGDILAEYVDRLRADAGVTINEDVLRAATGAGDAP